MKNNLDQKAIRDELRSKAVPFGGKGFGRFRLLSTVEEYEKIRATVRGDGSESELLETGPTEREWAPLEARTPSQGQIDPRLAPAIEFALRKIWYRFGGTIDDVLRDGQRSYVFEQLVSEACSDVTTAELGLGARRLRDRRRLLEPDLAALESLDPTGLPLNSPAKLSDLVESEVPNGPGIVQVSEPKRCLFVTGTPDLRATAGELISGQAFKAMASCVWQPDLDETSLQFKSGNSHTGSSMLRWEQRLILDRKPIFNWPVSAKS